MKKYNIHRDCNIYYERLRDEICYMSKFSWWCFESDYTTIPFYCETHKDPGDIPVVRLKEIG